MVQEQVAPRFKKPGLRDPKLLAGVLIIIFSLLGVIGLIRVTNQTEPYYVASRDIQLGEKVTTDNVQVVEVKLGDSANQYISVDQGLAEGSVAARPMVAGEIIASQALTTDTGDGRRLVTLLLDHYAVSAFEAGDRVDIWVSRKAEVANTYQDPEVIAEGAEIHSVTAQESIIGGTGMSAVELWVAPEAMPAVLGAANNGSVMNLVPSSHSEGAR
ncbi:SAF domain-containing protein [Rothia nasisuis]|uniref:SAF domain-containing protein n=1 Tax=Rothia nasisuis TaxID=2109647 RepID=UPI001F388A06|nr:SAF domain-containing protein [Rothia nasisuis]